MKLKKDLFLNNTVNKQKFINVLHDAFKRTDYTILHAKGDADLLIVKTAVESAKTADTILVGDDTDLLILLCYYADIHSKDLYLKPEPRQKTKTPRILDIKKVNKFVLAFCLYMLCLGVTPLPECMALETCSLEEDTNQWLLPYTCTDYEQRTRDS